MFSHIREKISLLFLPSPRLGVYIAIIIIFADQSTKWLIVEYVMQPPRTIYINKFMNLVLTWNHGISFGFFNNTNNANAIIITIIASLIVLYLFNWLSKAKTTRLKLSLGLIIGGAIGNIIDRILHGAVIDFLDLHFSVYHWPAFNVADSSITCGAVLLIIDSLFSRNNLSGKMD